MADPKLIAQNKAVILYGTNANPDSNWFPWLKKQLATKGYDSWIPKLPHNSDPDRNVYNNFLLEDPQALADSILIGHSSGAVAILNLLMDERCPNIKAAVLVSPWEHGYPNGDEWHEGQFDKLFPENGFDYQMIHQKCSVFKVIHARDDPYCPLEQAEHIASELNADITILPVASHLGSDYPEFPELWSIVSKVI